LTSKLESQPLNLKVHGQLSAS